MSGVSDGRFFVDRTLADPQIPSRAQTIPHPRPLSMYHLCTSPYCTRLADVHLCLNMITMNSLFLLASNRSACRSRRRKKVPELVTVVAV
jgi:hypothetical protein